MKKIIICFLAICLLIICSGQPSNAFEYESWPFEGMPYFRVKVDTLVLHKETEDNSEVAARLPVRKGSVITFPFGVKELLKRFQEPGNFDTIEKPDLINRKIILKDSIQKSVKPGIIRAVKAGSFKGYTVGKNNKIIKTTKKPKEQSFTFKKGDVIEDLLYLGEGLCLLNYRGTILEQETCLGQEIELDKSLVRESQPVTEWWVSVVQNKKILGWLSIDNSNDQLELIETIK
jgi:hypothetical protein